MKKSYVGIAVIVLAIAIVAVNFWKTSEKEEQTESAVQDSSATEEVSNAEPAGVQEGKPAPDFELTTLSGDKVKLSDYQGKKVILNFWATWCPPCKAEMPHMQSFYEKNKDQGIEVLAVNLTNADKGRQNIQEFVSDYGLSFPIPLDEQGSIGAHYQTYTIPTSYIIDTKGVIANKIVGPMDEGMMEDLVNSIN
ncbi:peroxiredoxin [Bacillus ectoiniformans]|uniref:redoxin domain-containing protein n=1 Tax=Bacillus ectoiniformans TaxID=1494429 RepID=UPI001957BEA6|nr:redoxin domain-containing protein [Bacillus ectoiniformans]MBM7647466.1 peroxiredoxin [Bacillus ectoiniformans]